MKKKYKILIAVSLIFTAIALITISVLDAFGLMPGLDTGIGKISIPAVLVTFLVLLPLTVRDVILNREFYTLPIHLVLLFMLFERNISVICKSDSENLINNWLLLGCGVLVALGLKIIIPEPLAKKRYFKIKFSSGRKRKKEETTVKYIDASALTEAHTGNYISSLVVRFNNIHAYPGGGVLQLGDFIGAVIVEVPKSWRFTCDFNKKSGKVHIEKCTAPEDAPHLTIRSGNRIGGIFVHIVD